MSANTPNVRNLPSPAVVSGDVLCQKAYVGTAALSGDGLQFTTRTINLPSYTPESANSKIIISIDADYLVDLYNSDEWKAVVRDPAGNILADKRQRWYGAGGGGTRSSTMLPLTVVYTNTSTAAKTFTFEISRVSGDDQFTMYSHRVVTFTEVAA